MKRLQPILVAVCMAIFFFSSLIAQPTLTAVNSNPKVGDSFLYQFISDSTFSTGDSGASVSWDYSNLMPDTSDQVTFQSASTMPNAASFPLASVGFIDGDGSEGYMLTSADSLSVYGFDDPVARISFTDPWNYMEYPFSFQDTSVDAFSGTAFSKVSMSSNHRRGTTEIIADGYGTLKLPYGDFSNVLRVKSIIAVEDTFANFGVISETQEIRYQWYVPGIKFPVVSYIRQTTVAFGVPPVEVTTLVYMDQTTAVRLDPFVENLKLNVYPNPSHANGKLDVTLSNAGDVAISILNMQGQLISMQKKSMYPAGPHTIDLNAPTLNKGIYMVKIEVGEAVGWKKWVIE